MDVDKQELMAQLREQIIKSNKYMKIEILVGDMNQFEVPFIEVKNLQAPLDSMAIAYEVLDDIKDILKQVNPGIDVIAKLFKPREKDVIFRKENLEDKGEQDG